jgi:hypothetical protein
MESDKKESRQPDVVSYLELNIFVHKIKIRIAILS